MVSEICYNKITTDIAEEITCSVCQDKNHEYGPLCPYNPYTVVHLKKCRHCTLLYPVGKHKFCSHKMARLLLLNL